MEQERAFAGRRRTLVGRGGNTDDGLALGKAGQCLPHAVGTFQRIELVTTFRQPGGCGDVIADAQGDDEVVAIVSRFVGRYPPRDRVDGRNRFVPQANARLDEVPVRQTHGVRQRAAEHHVEFGITEHERTGVVDQRDVRLGSQSVGYDRAELETAETCSQHRDSCAHRVSRTWLWMIPFLSSPLRARARAAGLQHRRNGRCRPVRRRATARRQGCPPRCPSGQS